ncbi:MAG: PfkB family carbohydrate kinase, partial [Burkholderiaceae bacterium]
MSPFPLQAVGNVNVLVVGDVMLDRYWFGEVDRISPEAPVPIVRVARREDRLGGAANVARNIVALGARATLVGIVGGDEAGQQIKTLAIQAGINES